MPRSKRPKLWRRAWIALKRGLIRFDRRPPAWVDEVTPWAGSLLAHAVLLILIAVVAVLIPPADDGRSGESAFAATLADQLVDDLTSLDRLDRAGDPFTAIDQETPSLAIDADPSLVNVPELAARFAPELSRSPIELTIERPDHFVPGVATSATRLGGASRLAPFSGRSAAMKAALLRREGGTLESEQAVELGLDWLVRHQGPAGNWTLDPRPHCTQGLCPGGETIGSDSAATGLALLPMLGAGHSHTEPGRYQASIDRGLTWLKGIQQPSGELFVGGGDNTRMYSHAIGAMALCEAYGVSRDPLLREPAERAIRFIILAQNQLDGGWRYQPGDSGDTSVFGWQMLALRSAALSGIPVPDPVVEGCRGYLDAASADPIGATYSYRPGRKASPVMTAEALLCRQYLGWKPGSRPLREGAAQVYRDLMTSGDRNVYYWYYATQMLHNLGGKPWQTWNARIRDGLVANQVKGDGCDRGSWDPNAPQPDQWGRSAGRHYTTCLSLLTLEVYYRYLPLYQERDSSPLGTDAPGSDD
ncbi:prenyltransferase/squalene oxidase repeat-containing protein [Tautonia sociabilis]|uniref:Squalene cyclase C-terminal domain-containing protein n=1 Tax=Tautonia sociabilis TaxID=2080755 RepID=A0A432MIY8_9BACT|nr:prenyltransferase/squalene oxidase repeat-containing protein [Tautonia sociabilis]RUL87158.1 hypothetical protein TsocGM_13855 [Tautonia sociabilis]